MFEDVYPSIECGRFPVKRIVDEVFEVWADIFREGHDVLAATLHWRRNKEKSWRSAPMQLHGNDRWHGAFVPRLPGQYVYAIEAWTDRFATWRRDYLLKRDAGEDVSVERSVGRQMLAEAMAAHDDVEAISWAADQYDRSSDDAVLLADDLATAMAEFQPRTDDAWSISFPLIIDRPIARAGAWYEIFPRSQGSIEGGHGTFKDCIARVPEIAALGFDVLYLTPIHPIGSTNRKGKNNALKPAAGRSRQPLCDWQRRRRP